MRWLLLFGFASISVISVCQIAQAKTVHLKGGDGTGEIKINPRLYSGEVAIRSVCMAPAEATLTQESVKGQESMANESDARASQVESMIESHLQKSGASLVPSGLGPNELQSNPELQQSLLEIQKKIDDPHSWEFVDDSQGIKKKNDRPKTIGDEVALLPCAAKADAIVFARQVAQIKTAGDTALKGGWLLPGGGATGNLSVNFVDSKSGEFLAQFTIVAFGNFKKDPEKMYSKLLDNGFRKIGIGAGGKKEKKK